MALAAWPQDIHDKITPKLPATLALLGRVLPNLRERLTIKDADRFAVFDPSGTRVFTAVPDSKGQVVDTITRRAIILSGHERKITSASFSPDGTQIVTTSDDQTARLWKPDSGELTAILKGHQAAVRSAFFSRDGTRIVTASDDKTARVWNARTGEPIATLIGHNGAVQSAVFSPDGTRIVTSSDDNTARLWD
jgi:WD40 repeat protein